MRYFFPQDRMVLKTVAVDLYYIYNSNNIKLIDDNDAATRRS